MMIMTVGAVYEVGGGEGALPQCEGGRASSCELVGWLHDGRWCMMMIMRIAMMMMMMTMMMTMMIVYAAWGWRALPKREGGGAVSCEFVGLVV